MLLAPVQLLRSWCAPAVEEYHLWHGKAGDKELFLSDGNHPRIEPRSANPNHATSQRRVQASQSLALDLTRDCCTNIRTVFSMDAASNIWKFNSMQGLSLCETWPCQLCKCHKYHGCFSLKALGTLRAIQHMIWRSLYKFVLQTTVRSSTQAGGPIMKNNSLEMSHLLMQLGASKTSAHPANKSR